MTRTLATFLAVVGLVLAPPAAASPEQILADRTAAWLEQLLHVPVPHQQIVPAAEENGQTWLAQSVPGEHRIEAVPWLIEEWSQMADPDEPQPAGAHALLHELLHLHHATVLEEGAVDAVALDLVAPWTQRFHGWGSITQRYGTGPDDAAYPDDVRLVRALSAAATDGRVRSTAARQWRRAFLVADDAGRHAMIETANARSRR
ncbi:hypothetical protein [Miltoncostaea oceani]|uniref:hypothetical protein n=1 Tax=Miltoncostaea oceani TaxID=2843216 RepID=UPI001C3E732A|nr:hypothetical protein [Miltoncostaea oceani]